MDLDPNGWPWHLNLDDDNYQNNQPQRIEDVIQGVADATQAQAQQHQAPYAPVPQQYWESDDPMQGINMASPQFIDDPELIRQSDQEIYRHNNPISPYGSQRSYRPGLTGPGSNRTVGTRQSVGVPQSERSDLTSTWGSGFTKGYGFTQPEGNLNDMETFDGVQSGSRGDGGILARGFHRSYWDQAAIENWLDTNEFAEPPPLGANVYHPQDIDSAFTGLMNEGTIGPDSLWWRRRMGN